MARRGTVVAWIWPWLAATSFARAQAPATPPRIAHFAPAVYPASARGHVGAVDVVLSLRVEADGRVSRATVLEPGGDGFDEAAIDAARGFTFTPAYEAGHAVAAEVRYRYHFAPPAEGHEAPAPPVAAAVFRGRIRTLDDHPIADATVAVRDDAGRTQRARTDASGAYRIELARPGRLTVAIDAAGYLPVRVTEAVQRNEDVVASYRLNARPGATNPSRARRYDGAAGDEAEATVRAERPRREVSRTTLERSELVRAPGTLGDALRALQNLPGLARVPLGSGSLIVRGSSPNDTQVLVDGTTLPGLYHFGALGTTLPTNALERIDFYPGNFSARFGRATGGVVDVGLRSPIRQGARAEVNIGLLDATAFVEAAVAPTVSAMVSARFMYGGLLITPIVNAFTPANVFVGYWDYQGVVEWRPTPRDRVRLAVFGSSDTVALFTPQDCSMAPAGCVAGDGDGMNVVQDFHLVQARWVHRFSAATESRATISTGFIGLTVGQNTRMHGLALSDQLELTSVPVHVRYEFSHALSPQARVDLGIDSVFGPRHFHNGVTGLSVPDDTRAVVLPGAYVEAELTPVTTLHAVPGVRFDYAGSIQQAVVQPRFSTRWDVAPGWSLKAGVGYFAQPPLRDRVTIPPELLLLQNQIPASVPERFERAVHYALGLEHDFSRWISLSVEGYYKTISDALVGFPSLDLLLAGESPRIDPSLLRSDGLGRAYGVEVLLRHRLSDRFYGWLAYSLSRAERRDCPSCDWRPFEFDQTHNLIVLGSYRLGDGWEVGARFRYVTGRPTTQARVVYDANSGSYVSAPGVPYGSRVFDFHQLDLRVEKRWEHPWGNISLCLEVLNVYNRFNAESYQFSPDGTQNHPAGAFVPIFPNLGLRGEL